MSLRHLLLCFNLLWLLYQLHHTECGDFWVCIWAISPCTTVRLHIIAMRCHVCIGHVPINCKAENKYGIYFEGGLEAQINFSDMFNIQCLCCWAIMLVLTFFVVVWKFAG
jgi:hypothetical protein